MKTILQIGFGVLLGGFVLLFCMANDDWVVIHLPLAPWNVKPSIPVFETRLFALMLACFGTGIFLSVFFVYFLKMMQRTGQLEKDRKIAALENELAKANRLLSATSKNMADDKNGSKGQP
jgi:hypothetical protein